VPTRRKRLEDALGGAAAGAGGLGQGAHAAEHFLVAAGGVVEAVGDGDDLAGLGVDAVG
jgi:hypothetical protein